MPATLSSLPAAAQRSMAPRRAAGANDVFMPCADVKLVPVAPDDQCLYRELVYKSSVVAMFDKKESGKKLPIDRLLKMQVAAKRTAEREAKPASTDTTPSAQPTEAAADVEGVSTEPDDHLLRIGSDFAMAFVYSGTGKATRRVAWLGRVEKLRHNVVYPVDVSLVPYVYA